MKRKKLANVIAGFHALWVLLGITHIPFLFLFPWWNKVSLIFAGLTTGSWLTTGGCFLNKWELKLRQLPPEDHKYGFIFRYFRKRIPFNIPVRLWQSMLWAYMIFLIWLSL